MVLEDSAATVRPDSWTQAFYGGRASIVAAIYADHFSTVSTAVSAVLHGADAETAVHEVFLRMLTNEEMRRAYRGGKFSSWLFTVARNHAIDYARRRARERPVGLCPGPEAQSQLEGQIEARAVIRKFREEVLPPEWVATFDARFVDQLDQRAAAVAAGVPRTTLVYREIRIRRMLRMFLVDSEVP